ncbi:TPA: hypothetical protein U0K61_002276, partial [Streptococcus suis]|nr:hypothetical protein [Streptococcus suis]
KRIKFILINQLENLLKSLLEEKIDIEIIYYFLQDSIQIARYFADKESQDLLERFSYEIVDYNQKAFLKLSSSTEDFSSTIAYEFKSKYIISPIINSDWIPKITDGETIEDFLNKLTTA